MSIHTSIHTGLLGAMVAAVVAGTTHVAATRTAEPPGSIHELTIITTDFSFEAPDTVPEGLTRIHLRNKGSEHHHAQLVRLRDGGTIQELLDTLGTRMTNVPPGTRYLGGPNVPPAGGWSEVTVQLEPGRYALICFVSGADHVAHMRKGMTRLLLVKAGKRAERAASPEPTPDSRMVLHDYAFDIKPAIRPGRQVIRVEGPSAADSSSFDWSGVFDLVAIGYPDGDRSAVMQIAKTDTSYSLVSVGGTARQARADARCWRLGAHHVAPGHRCNGRGASRCR